MPVKSGGNVCAAVDVTDFVVLGEVNVDPVLVLTLEVVDLAVDDAELLVDLALDDVDLALLEEVAFVLDLVEDVSVVVGSSVVDGNSVVVISLVVIVPVPVRDRCVVERLDVLPVSGRLLERLVLLEVDLEIMLRLVVDKDDVVAEVTGLNSRLATLPPIPAPIMLSKPSVPNVPRPVIMILRFLFFLASSNSCLSGP